MLNVSIGKSTVAKNNRVVVYTAIFGKKDDLIEPLVVPKNCDFICFTDLPLASKVWKVRNITRPHPDATRAARRVKLLPHEFVPEYETSLWVDGNMLIKTDINQLLATYLRDGTHLAVYDMHQQKKESRDCIVDELAQLLVLNGQGKFQDEITLMQGQEIGRAHV